MVGEPFPRAFSVSFISSFLRCHLFSLRCVLPAFNAGAPRVDLFGWVPHRMVAPDASSLPLFPVQPALHGLFPSREKCLFVQYDGIHERAAVAAVVLPFIRVPDCVLVIPHTEHFPAPVMCTIHLSFFRFGSLIELPGNCDTRTLSALTYSPVFIPHPPFMSRSLFLVPTVPSYGRCDGT